MPAELTEQEYAKARNAKEDVNQSTIDNNATTTEIQYLARLYQATQKEKYKEGVLKGIQYLLKAQYDNGGWIASVLSASYRILYPNHLQ